MSEHTSAGFKRRLMADGWAEDVIDSEFRAIEAGARAGALTEVEALHHGYIHTDDGFEAAVSLKAVNAILAERRP